MVQQNIQSAERGGQPFEDAQRIGSFELDPEHARRHVVRVAERYIREALRTQLGPYVAAHAVAEEVQRPAADVGPLQVPLRHQFEVVMTTMDPGYVETINDQRPITQVSSALNASTEAVRDTFDEMMTGASLGDDFNNAASNSDFTPPESPLTPASSNV